jgi:hypothetical protein
LRIKKIGGSNGTLGEHKKDSTELDILERIVAKNMKTAAIKK